MPLWPGPPSKPNLHETTGTTLPLMATVLAGFDVTLIAQVGGLLGGVPSAFDMASVYTLHGFCLLLAVSGLVASPPCSLLAVGCAIWGQTYNFATLISLDTAVRERVYGVTDANLERYLKPTHREWSHWHDLSGRLFALGESLLVLGVLGFLGRFVSVWAAIAGFVLSVGVFILWRLWIRRQPTIVPGLPHLSVTPAMGPSGTGFRFALLGGPVQHRITWTIRDAGGTVVGTGNANVDSYLVSQDFSPTQFSLATTATHAAGSYSVEAVAEQTSISSGAFTIAKSRGDPTTSVIRIAPVPREKGSHGCSTSTQSAPIRECPTPGSASSRHVTRTLEASLAAVAARETGEMRRCRRVRPAPRRWCRTGRRAGPPE